MSLINIVQRPQLLALLDEYIESHIEQGSEFALLLIRPDNFRKLNIDHGYAAGDRLLASLYQCISQMAREQDRIIRTSGSEFLLLLPSMHNEGHATLAAMKLLGEIERYSVSDDDLIQFSVHIGITHYPSHAQDSLNLLRNVEVALLKARQSAESYCMYSTQDDPTDTTNWDIQADLQTAIENNQFQLYFQPQVDLAGGQIIGAEALLRWVHPQRSFIPPDYFIPIAEKTRFIDDITEWTIRNALWLIRDWPETSETLRVSVNLSPKVLGDESLTESIVNSAKIFNADLQCLTLEITESALMEDISKTIIILEQLRAEGINISIDDFGSGYSSMAYFKNIPANELKIDKSFVTNMLENPANLHIVSSIIDMAQGFGLKVIAEGIEDLQTYEKLQEMGCDIAQGYYVAKPMPNDDYIKWFNQYTEVTDQLSAPQA